MTKRDKKNRRENRITVRFTEKEKAFLEEKAAEARVTPVEYLRRSICRQQFDYIVYKQVDDLIYEIHRIGNNINQIAHNANSGYFNEAEAKRLLANMKVLTDLVGKVAAKIGDQ